MPATNFHEYARGVENILDATVAAGEAALVSIQIDPRSALRGFIAGVLQFGEPLSCTFENLWTPAWMSPGWCMPITTRM